MIPFIEKILGDYLRENPEIEALVGDRVGTKSPGTLAEPWIRITTIDDPPVGKSKADHLIAFYMQIDCFAGKDGTQSEASRLARTVRLALGEMHEGEHEGAVVSGAKVTGSRPLPDATFAPTMDRYIITATVWAHSTIQGGS